MKTNYSLTIKLLDKLHKEFPNCSVGKHIYRATIDNGPLESMDDKELLYHLEKYYSLLEIVPEDTPESIDQIIEDGKHLFDNYITEEDEE